MSQSGTKTHRTHKNVFTKEQTFYFTSFYSYSLEEKNVLALDYNSANMQDIQKIPLDFCMDINGHKWTCQKNDR